ncbi:hypothetical protein EMQ25_03525 [Arsenicitalea aurantiaca]|uniref:Uncharacterized protein n=1 Tax=Arsenicitalea aurantiaca TaxID=1783274 RepID=A0A433XLS6_9HYPH|nr:hypothetical protein [Arsenicitalea aurantiaca]RUT35035.1 hypothetical protein EMQ25_03525 [Arsenicitalea aurantiaca]
MQKDVADMVKAIASMFAFFAVATFLSLLGLDLLVRNGGGLPVIGGLSAHGYAEALGVLTGTGLYRLVGPVFLMASAIALALRSAYLDHMLQLIGKAAALLIAASLGLVAGHWGVLRLMQGRDIALDPFVPIVIAFALATIAGLFFRPENYRASTPVRVVLVGALALAAPITLAML